MQEIMLQIEQACNANNHQAIKEIIFSVESFEMKKQAFLKIIGYYENRGIFPAGYALLFIKYLLQINELSAAMKQISKAKEKGVDEKKISQIVYEYLIKPNESFYKENFGKNLRLLQDSEVLISTKEFDFDKIKHNITIISSHEDNSALPAMLFDAKDTIFFLLDLINMEAIRKILENNTLVYLAYPDIQKFYYILLFEDLSLLSQYIQKDKLNFCKAVFFAGIDIAELKRFFDNMLVYRPKYTVAKQKYKHYQDMMAEIDKQRDIRIVSYLENLNIYYRDKDYEYYKNLFSKPTSEIKILLINSIHTTMNQYITRAWYEAFIKLGYTAKFIIEEKPYEMMNVWYAIEQIYEYKPDIVFWINFTIHDTFKSIKGDLSNIIKNLLWIMRYRDKRNFTLQSHSYDCNMFITYMHKIWENDLILRGVPERRRYYIPEGIDEYVFCKKNKKNKDYQFDVVSVNHSVGMEGIWISKLLDTYNDDKWRWIVNNLYDYIIEMTNSGVYYFFHDDLEKLITDKLKMVGFSMSESDINYLSDRFTQIIAARFRGRLIEWIIDSGITNNIALWGIGWSNIERFKPFHRGIAKHGEQLAEIYRNSKISISDSQGQMHERTFEILASGGFPIVLNVEPKNNENIDRITNYFKENEDIVLFSPNRDVFLSKIQYYLDHPEERERIAENGRQVVLNNFTSTAVAKKTMEFIKNYYK